MHARRPGFCCARSHTHECFTVASSCATYLGILRRVSQNGTATIHTAQHTLFILESWPSKSYSRCESDRIPLPAQTRRPDLLGSYGVACRVAARSSHLPSTISRPTRHALQLRMPTIARRQGARATIACRHASGLGRCTVHHGGGGLAPDEASSPWFTTLHNFSYPLRPPCRKRLRQLLGLA